MIQPNDASPLPPVAPVQLTLQPFKAGLPIGQPLSTKVLVRLVSTLPLPNETKERSPLDLAIVIDRSGSMSGGPLAAAIGAAQNLIRGLRPTDRVSVVAFDNEVNVVLPLSPVENREEVCQRIGEIRCGGSTALFNGWEEGARQLAPFTAANRTSRVILLTDGQANQGLTDETAIAAKVRELAKAGVTTSTVGLGGEFNETLLGKMADAGEGQAHYGQRPEDLEEGFAEEFALISASHLRQVELKVTSGSGVVAQVLRRDGTRGESSRLGTLPYSASLDAIVALAIGTPRAASGLVSVAVTAKDGSGDEINLGPVVLALPELEPAAFAALPADPMVAAACIESDFADEFLRIHELARSGKPQEALSALRELRQRPGASQWATRTARYILGLADEDLELAIKELSYSGRAFRGRVKEVDLKSAYCASFDMGVESDKLAYLSKKLGMGRSRARSVREERNKD